MSEESETVEPTGEGAPASEIDARLARIPPSPGVYLLRDRNRKVIYVGKAKSLRARVRMYFRGGDERIQVPFLARNVTDIETLVTRNEKEALILENNLIKQYKPRYNVRLKDDKSYVSAKVTVQDAWPRVVVTRKIEKDGSRYFGPFPSAWAVRASLDAMRKIFPLRNCPDTVFRNRARPCLEYQIQRCPGPCCLEIDREEYARNLKNAMLLLDGRNVELVRELRSRMDAASEALRFEEAARLRDQVRALEKTAEPQEMVSHFGLDQDVFGLYREGGCLEIQVLLVRRGKLTESLSYSLDDLEFPDEIVVAEVLGQFYSGGRELVDEVLIPVDVEDREAREAYLTELRGKKVGIFRPQRGDRVRLIEMATENARQAFATRRSSEAQRSRQADELRKRLGLRGIPRRVECFDISNIQGRFVVGSKVSFEDGEPDKSRYRRYRVRHVEGQDDFASLYEVLKRRLGRGLEEKDLPDLLVIDGGKGQLGVATAVLEDLGIRDLDVVGLAKDRVERDAHATEIRRSEERVFLPGRKNSVVLPRNSTALFLLQRVRDEAHRFAITFHRELRGRERLRSPLDDVAGVGPERRRRLLRHFGSVRKLAAATAEEIATVPGIGLDLAREVLRSLREREERRRPATGRLVLKPLGVRPGSPDRA